MISAHRANDESVTLAGAPASFLAKDYASFRQLLLERLAITLPDRDERHVPDVLVTLLELLAYAGDRLSYYQDAVGTEAYLSTARRRISLRRHAALVGYRVHEGHNARTWVCLEVDEATDLDLDSVYFISSPAGIPEPAAVLRESALTGLPPSGYHVYEPVGGGARRLLPQASRMRVEDRSREGALAKGATSAVLLSHDRAGLERGSVLVFEEVVGPAIGGPCGSGGMCHAVRLTGVRQEGGRLHVRWSEADALPSRLPLGSGGGSIVVAFGNVFLVDQGVRLSRLHRLRSLPGTAGELHSIVLDTPTQPATVRLTSTPMIHSAPPWSDGEEFGSAQDLLYQDPQDAEPAIIEATVTEPGYSEGTQWFYRSDLIHSGPNDRHFTVEIDDDDIPFARFGDGQLGRSVVDSSRFTIDYRVASGPSTAVGPGLIRHIVMADADVSDARIGALHNPFAAAGVAAEPPDVVRLQAPTTIRTAHDRAVTASDYEVAARVAGVQAARARVRWTGTSHLVEVYVDAAGRSDLPEELRRRIERELDRRRMIGHRIVVLPPRYVPVEVDLSCRIVGDNPLKVLDTLKVALGNGHTSDGSPGFFHPDRFTFGDHVATSRLVATALSVHGVVNARVVSLRAPGHDDVCGGAREDCQGVLRVEDFEIVRLADAGSAGRPGLRVEAGMPS